MPLIGCQDLVYAMSQLMSQSHDIPCLALIIQQQVRVSRGHGRVRERAGRFTRAHRRIDPGIVEKPLADIRQLSGKGAVGRQHRVPRIVPRHDAVVPVRWRRVAVPVIKLINP